MEAINVFIDGCKKYGVSEKDMFVTLDLYERTNPNMVRFLCFVVIPDIPLSDSIRFYTCQSIHR